MEYPPPPEDGMEVGVVLSWHLDSSLLFARSSSCVFQKNILLVVARRRLLRLRLGLIISY